MIIKKVKTVREKNGMACSTRNINLNKSQLKIASNVIKHLKNQKFISNKFFLDAEIISFFDQKNLKITSVPIKYKISKTSSIRILALNNILYFYELFKIIITRLVKFR